MGDRHVGACRDVLVEGAVINIYLTLELCFHFRSSLRKRFYKNSESVLFECVNRAEDGAGLFECDVFRVGDNLSDRLPHFRVSDRFNLCRSKPRRVSSRRRLHRGRRRGL